MANTAKMKQDTVDYIRNMLKMEIDARRSMMLDAIGNKFPSMNDRIKQYQETYEAEQDYLEWLYEQKDYHV